MNTTTRPIRSRGTLRALIALATICTVLGSGIGAAAASDGCGEYSFGFLGTRLLNDGISDSAGPFPITLPTGVYDVTLESFDDHTAHPGQVDQTAEQYVVILDSGWVSPPSIDIPDDSNRATTVHRDQVIAESTAISVRHLGEGGVNSVDVLCVGFTPATVALGLTEDPVDEPESSDPIDPLSLTRPQSETPESPSDPIDPQYLTRPVQEEIEPEVQGQVETGPVLALTGPSTATTLALAGVVLLAMGSVLIGVERRRLAIR